MMYVAWVPRVARSCSSVSRLGARCRLSTTTTSAPGPALSPPSHASSSAAPPSPRLSVNLSHLLAENI